MRLPPFVSYHAGLVESLRDPEEAASNLYAAIEDGNLELLMMAIQNVAEDQGGLENLSGKIHFVGA